MVGKVKMICRMKKTEAILMVSVFQISIPLHPPQKITYKGKVTIIYNYLPQAFLQSSSLCR